MIIMQLMNIKYVYLYYDYTDYEHKGTGENSIPVYKILCLIESNILFD